MNKSLTGLRVINDVFFIVGGTIPLITTENPFHPFSSLNSSKQKRMLTVMQYWIIGYLIGRKQP